MVTHPSPRRAAWCTAGLILLSLAGVAPLAGAGPPPARTEQADARLLYTTWHWVRTEGDPMAAPGGLTPGACRCEGLLILKTDGKYEFVVQDSVRENSLWQGLFTVRRPAHGAERTIGGAPADFLISFTDWWVDSERDQLVRFSGSDTLLTASARPGRSGQVTRRWYARDANQPLPGDEGSSDFISPEPSTMVQPVYPDSLLRRGLHGEIKLQVMVGKDGLVKKIKVISAPPGMSEPVIEAVRKWRFKPAREHGRPVAVWIEMPIRFEE